MSFLERGRVPSPRPIAIREIQLVDRAEEMKLLKEAVDGAIQGDGGVVFLYGEAGIGKTRLTRELGAYARSRGVQVLYGRCPALFRMDGVPPYVLWKEVIKDYLETCTPEQLYRVVGYYPAEVAKLVPELSQKLRVIPQSFPISPEQEQNRLFEAVSQFITNISQETPLLVILDDLQWTDPSSLLLLHYLARGVQKTSLLLVGAYRSTDIDSKHPISSVLSELNRERLLQSIHLKRMSLSDVSEIIKSILEQEDAPTEFCTLIYEKTKGNPFFAEEVVKSLKEEDVIYREKNKWKIEEVTAIEFPETVKNVVKTRLDRLDNECQNVLTFASFVGNDFTLETMCAVTGIEKSKLIESIDRMFKTGLIKERMIRGEGFCSFGDTLVRDVVYEEISPLRRKELHGVVGRALENLYSSKMDEHFGELAYHFLETGDKEKALDYFLKAGDRASKIYANAEAVSYLEHALSLLEENESELQEKASLLERLGDVEKLIGRYDACVKHWNEALSLWAKLHEKNKTTTLHGKMANVLWEKTGNVKEAKNHQDEVLKVLEAEPESIELARLYEDISHMYWRNGEVAKALPLAEKALALAEKLNALETVADSSNDLSILSRFTGNFKKSGEYANRALTIALDNGYLETALWAYYRVSQSLPSEEYEKCLECLENGLALARKLGDVGGQCMFLQVLAQFYAPVGELNKAITLAEEGVALSRKAGNITSLSLILGALGFAYQISGEWGKSGQCFAELSSISRKLNEFQPVCLSHFSSGLQHFDKEEFTKARNSFEEAVKVAENAGSRSMQMWSSQFLIWASLELGEIEKAQNLLDSLQKFALETQQKYFYANEMALKAMLLRAQKKRDESIELFETTLKEWESLKADIWNAYFFARWVLCENARTHLERNADDDKEKARSLLNQALKTFQRMDAKKDIEKVEAKIAFIETGKVVLKPKPTECVSTGHVDLDKLLYGGIPIGFAVVLTSPSCNERDSLVKGFLETGTKNNEVTFYVTINPGSATTLADEFQSSFFLFVCNPQADAIVENRANVIKLKGVENLTDISIALTSTIRNLDSSLMGARRICLDIISDVLLQHHAVQTRRWLAGLIPELRSKGFTTLAVMEPKMHPSEELHAVLGLFDGEIDIYERETKEGSKKFLKIKRMSNQKYLDNELPLRRENQE